MSINYSTQYIVISGFVAPSLQSDHTLFDKKEAETHGGYDDESGVGMCLISLDKEKMREDPNHEYLLQDMKLRGFPDDRLLVIRSTDEIIIPGEGIKQKSIDYDKKRYEPKGAFQTSSPFSWTEAIYVLHQCDKFSYEKVAWIHQYRINDQPVTYIRYDHSWERGQKIETAPLGVTLSNINLYIQSTGYDHRLLRSKYSEKLEEFCAQYDIEYRKLLVDRPHVLVEAEKEIKAEALGQFPFVFITYRHIGIFLALMQFLTDLGYCGCFSMYNMYETQKMWIGDNVVLFSCVDAESG